MFGDFLFGKKIYKKVVWWDIIQRLLKPMKLQQFDNSTEEGQVLTL